MGYSVKEIVDTYQKYTDEKIKVEYGKRREGDAPIACFDCSKFYTTFNWKPRFTLDDMCKDSINFVKKYPEGIN